MYIILKLPGCKRSIIISTNIPEHSSLLTCIADCYYPFASICEKIENGSSGDLAFYITKNLIHFQKIGSPICWHYDNQYNLFRMLMRHIQNNIFLDKGYGILHGSALQHRGKTMLFIGKSGTGKTTLAAYLNWINNMSFIADDILMLELERMEVYRANSCFRLRSSAINVLSPHNPFIMQKCIYNKTIDRYLLPGNNNKNIEKAKIDYIFILDRNTMYKSTKIYSCNESQDSILMNAFCPYSILANLYASIQLANRSQVFTLSYSDLANCGDTLNKFIY